MNYNLLAIFVKVADLGSFTRAAKALNQPKSRISRSIAKLEAELKVQLIRRTTRKTTLTSSGQEFFQNISPHLDSIKKELARVSQGQQEMSGKIRVTASQDIAQTLVAQLISDFNSKFPNVQFETFITNDFLDLTQENIDVAFRAGKLQDSILKQKKILSVNFIIVCSKKYSEAYGTLTDVKDLLNHNFLSFKGMEKTFLDKKIELQPIVISDSIPMLLNMVLNNNGIAILPDFFCKDHLESGGLVRLLPSWKSKTENIHAVYPPSNNISQKVKLFIKMASSFFD